MTCLTLFEPVWSYRNEFIMEIGDLNAIITFVDAGLEFIRRRPKNWGDRCQGNRKCLIFFVRRYLGKILKWYETRMISRFPAGENGFLS